tara:strand:- start:1231 stop:2055 length:825 start_codon:yes stop_codon:yes gene_type:complete
MKIYFLTPEIFPFSNTSFLSMFSKFVPINLQKNNHDIRLTSPKYGFISERKYTLREVIRLREINTKIGEGFEVASAKSAFIPKTRVQVYFMEHENFFQPLTPLLYKAKNGRPLPDNGDRFGFFSKMSLEMLVNLFWSPNLIICNDWHSSFVPIVYEQLFSNQDFYKNIKTIQIIHNLDDYNNVPSSLYSELGVTLPEDFKGDEINSIMVGSYFADQVIAIDSKNKNISKEIIKNKKFHNKIKNKFHIIDLNNEDEESCEIISDQINDLIKETFE